MQAGVHEDATAEVTLTTVARFNDSFNGHDIDAVMTAMTEDCVFESTESPDGKRYEGQAAVRAVWEDFFRASPDAVFDAEDIIAAGDRCIVRWLYRWTDAAGRPGHIRGVDLFRIRNGKIAEKFAYVKG